METKPLKPGDVIELTEGHSVYAKAPKHFLYSNRTGDFSLDRGLVKIGGELGYLAGRYIVTKTAADGGGCGHGPGDVYPDGHHVWCVRSDGADEVDFYQSGCFTAMIVKIDVIGHAEQVWKETTCPTPPQSNT